MKNTLPVFFFTFLLIGMLPLVFSGNGVAHAQVPSTYYTAKNGSDTNLGTEAAPFLTVNKGVSVLTPGDTLYVKAGTYAESFTNPPGGTSWANPVTIAAFPGDTVILRPNPGAGRVFTFASSQSKYIIIDGFVMDAVNASSDAIKMQSGASEPHHIRIQNSEVMNSPNQGILVTGGEFYEFINLHVHHNGTRATFDHGFYISTGNNLVENCICHNNAAYGIQIQGGGINNIVRNNLSYDNLSSNPDSSGGIYVAGSDNTLVYNNVVYGNGNGIRIHGTSGSKVYNNTVTDNSNLAGIYISPDSVGVVVRNNVVFGNESGGYPARGNIVNLGTNTVLSNNLTTDPLFINEAGRDLHLQAGSPAIDAGMILVEVPTDYDGTTRPQGAAYDIGAYEFGSGSSPPPPPSAPTPTPPPPPPSSGPISHWKFDESSGTTASDSEGTNNGTLTNMDSAADWVSGRIGNALDFDGSNDSVAIADSASLNVPYATVSMWVKWDAVINNAGIIAKGDNSNRQYWIWTWNGTLDWEIDGVYATSPTALQTGLWYHVALIYDGSNTRLYLNGTLDTAFPQTSGTIFSDDDPLLIGQLPGYGYFDGQIDDVRIYNRALTAAEVTALYSSSPSLTPPPTPPPPPPAPTPTSPPPPSFNIADFNQDGKVDIVDVSFLLSRWGKTDAVSLTEADISTGFSNSSLGKIDIYDANKLMANWSK